jgi:hypothetical protein
MPNFTLRIVKRGKNPLQFIKEVTGRSYPELQNEIVLSAEATAEIMKRILLDSGYRLDKLADAINAEVLSSTAGVRVGIGRIDGLPKGIDGRDYWNAFNDGWLPPPNWGYFTSGSGLSGDRVLPMAGTSGQRWIHTGKERGSYYMQPIKPIEPLKFVDIGYDELKKHINKQIDKFIKELGHTHGWGMGAGGAK